MRECGTRNASRQAHLLRAEMQLTIINAGLSAATAKVTTAQAERSSAFVPHMLVSLTATRPSSSPCSQTAFLVPLTSFSMLAGSMCSMKQAPFPARPLMIAIACTSKALFCGQLVSTPNSQSFVRTLCGASAVTLPGDGGEYAQLHHPWPSLQQHRKSRRLHHVGDDRTQKMPNKALQD